MMTPTSLSSEDFLTSKNQFSISLSIYLSTRTQNITSPCLFLSRRPPIPFCKWQFFYPLIWMLIYGRWEGVSFYALCAAYLYVPIFALYYLLCLPWFYLISPLRSSWSNIILSVWSDPLAPIQYICEKSDPIRSDCSNLICFNIILSDPCQSNLLTYVWYTPQNILWSSLLLPIYPNSIC